MNNHNTYLFPLTGNVQIVRYIYSFLLYLLMPYLFLRLLWKSRHLAAFRYRMAERLGFYPVSFKQSLWVHAVSVGESIAAAPLIKALHKRYPSLPIVVTTMTPTGAEQVKTMLGDTVTHVYIPYDFPDAANRFLQTMNPVIAVIMETELWPNMVAACYKRNIPFCLMNARLSEKSARGYKRIASLTREMLQHIAVIAAHGQRDAERFIELGAPRERVIVTGNIKFDIAVPSQVIEQGQALRVMLGKDKFVWIAASTHEGEEEIILAAHKILRARYPQALLI